MFFVLKALEGEEIMEEFQIWSLYQSARIGNGLMIIATVLIIWLSLRTAIQTRTPVVVRHQTWLLKCSQLRFAYSMCFSFIATFASYNNP